MNEYRITKSWKILFSLSALVLIGLFGWILASTLVGDDYKSGAIWFLVLLSVSVIAGMVVGLLAVFKSKLIITDNSIKTINIFSTRELRYDEIRGCSFSEQVVIIKPQDDQKKSIKITRFTEAYYDILDWLLQNFPDAEAQDAIYEEEDILNDETLGTTQEIRAKKLTKARKIASTVNWLAGFIATWTLFFPTPYQYAWLASLVTPIVALIVVKLSGGLIRVDERKGSAYPSVVYALIYPSIALFARSFFDYDIFDYSNVWEPTLIITLVFYLFCFSNKKSLRSEKAMTT